MILNFDSNGNIKPYEIIDIKIEDVKTNFVDKYPKSKTRKDIFEGYIRYNNDFFSVVNASWYQLINGSYTTKKENPIDIDLVNFIDFSILSNKLLPFLVENGSKDTYMVDGYLVPIVKENDPRYSIVKHNIDYWENWFGRDRQRNKKGVLKIEINGKINL
jgi:hypothetical protein